MTEGERYLRPINGRTVEFEVVEDHGSVVMMKRVRPDPTVAGAAEARPYYTEAVLGGHGGWRRKK